MIEKKGKKLNSVEKIGNDEHSLANRVENACEIVFSVFFQIMIKKFELNSIQGFWTWGRWGDVKLIKFYDVKYMIKEKNIVSKM